MGEIPEDWRRVNIALIFKKGGRKLQTNQSNFKIQKDMEQIIKQTICKHLKAWTASMDLSTTT